MKYEYNNVVSQNFNEIYICFKLISSQSEDWIASFTETLK